jgi:hypothetical protein
MEQLDSKQAKIVGSSKISPDAKTQPNGWMFASGILQASFL